MTQTEWFHGSIHKLEVGEILRGGVMPSNFKGISDETKVSITSETSYALLWPRRVAKREGLEQIYVYRVRPLHPITVWIENPKNYGKAVAYIEARTEAAVIEEIVFSDTCNRLGDSYGERDGLGVIL